MGFDNRPMMLAEATEILDFFQNSPEEKYRVYVMGGVPSKWRTNPKAGWEPVFLRLDGVKKTMNNCGIASRWIFFVYLGLDKRR